MLEADTRCFTSSLSSRDRVIPLSQPGSLSSERRSRVSAETTAISINLIDQTQARLFDTK